MSRGAERCDLRLEYQNRVTLSLRALCTYSTYPPMLHVKVQLEYTCSTCGVPYSTTEFRVQTSSGRSTSRVQVEYK